MRAPVIMATFLWAGAALAAPGTLKVTVEGIEHNNAPIPAKYALCQPTPEGKSKGGENIRPAIRWSGAPESTRSFAVVVKDPDVPADFTDAGKDGKVVKNTAKRQLFYHWALADIPAATHEIPGGKSYSSPDFGMKVSGSLEKYVDDPAQYGGPCPPWNDERVHHYHFTVYALDVATLNLPTDITAAKLEKAMQGHVLASGNVVGTYTLNKQLQAQ